MMGIDRPGVGIGLVLVGIAIVASVFRPWGSFAAGMPASSGTAVPVLVLGGVVGIAVVSWKFLTGNTTHQSSDTTGAAGTEEALETLKRRYADGELDQIEFERKLEMVFETETVADAERRVGTQSVSGEQRSREETESGRAERSPRRLERPSKREGPRPRRGHCK